MSFGDELKRFRLKSVKVASETQKAIVLELFGSVILDTPVDTGRARGNWQTTNNAPAQGETKGLDPSGARALARLEAEIVRFDKTIYLSNNLPYAGALEYGYSDQAPAGMVRKNIARVNRIINKEIRIRKI